VINSTNLAYFNEKQKAEFFCLKGVLNIFFFFLSFFCSLFGPNETKKIS